MESCEVCGRDASHGVKVTNGKCELCGYKHKNSISDSIKKDMDKLGIRPRIHGITTFYQLTGNESSDYHINKAINKEMARFNRLGRKIKKPKRLR